MAGPRPFDVVCHSPVRRAAETTGHVVAALGPDIEVECVQDLRVAEHGEDGQHPWDPQTNLIGTIPPLDPETAPGPGAESWQAYLDRSGRALLDIAARHEGRRVLVIAHSETSASALHAFMRLPARRVTLDVPADQPHRAHRLAAPALALPRRRSGRPVGAALPQRRHAPARARPGLAHGQWQRERCQGRATAAIRIRARCSARPSGPRRSTGRAARATAGSGRIRGS
jgi:hypothetical protein